MRKDDITTAQLSIGEMPCASLRWRSALSRRQAYAVYKPAAAAMMLAEPELPTVRLE